MTCFTLCVECGAPIGASEDAHQWHDPDTCDRMLNGWCRCDGWLCAACCGVSGECSPLQEACLAAREEVVARAEAWEAAQVQPASTERTDTVPAHPLTGFYFGGVG